MESVPDDCLSSSITYCLIFRRYVVEHCRTVTFLTSRRQASSRNDFSSSQSSSIGVACTRCSHVIKHTVSLRKTPWRGIVD